MRSGPRRRIGLGDPVPRVGVARRRAWAWKVRSREAWPEMKRERGRCHVPSTVTSLWRVQRGGPRRPADCGDLGQDRKGGRGPAVRNVRSNVTVCPCRSGSGRQSNAVTETTPARRMLSGPLAGIQRDHLTCSPSSGRTSTDREIAPGDSAMPLHQNVVLLPPGTLCDEGVWEQSAVPTGT